MYSHQVEIYGNFASMTHVREVTSAGGLVIPSILGSTVAFAQQVENSSGIQVASAFDTMRFGSKPQLAIDDESIMCDDLAHFKSRGIEEWKALIEKMGEVVSFRLELIENTEPNEVNSLPSGLIIPGEKPETAFKGYEAMPDEIEAMQAIEQAMVSMIGSPDSDDPRSQLYA